MSIAALLLAGATLLAAVGHRHYPIQHWMFWRYASYWLGAALFVAACFSTGHLVCTALLPRRAPLFEHAFSSFAVGVLVFTLAMFVAGIAQLYHPVLFFALPLVMLAAGAPSSWRTLARVWPRLNRARARAARPPAWTAALLLFGCASLGALYFLALSPDNIQFDARWKHIALAEDYVASGGIRRFPEGWLFSTRPHGSSYLYAWAFSYPGGLLFDRVEMCAHLELAIFVVTTLVGIGALTRALVPTASSRTVWVARFLFPGVLLYDSNLSGGADHIAAMYAAAICLFVLRIWRDPSPRRVLLLGAMLSGAVLTKETAAVMLVPVPVVAVAVRIGLLAWTTLRGRPSSFPRHFIWLTPLVGIAACLALTSPLWLTNLVWHGSPLYPVAAERFSPRPWLDEAVYLYRWAYLDAQFDRPPLGWRGLARGLEVMATFSFVPNDWERLHGNVPVFGSLFTLLLPALVFLKKTRRTWYVVAWIHVAVFSWHFVLSQDRYLQALMPLIAAVTAAVLTQLWRMHSWLVRGPLVALVLLQVVWGGDVYFIQTHSMARAPIKDSVDLLEGGFRKQYSERLRFLSHKYVAIGKAAPGAQRVLLHEFHDHLGIGKPVVMDWPGFQFAISYSREGNPRAIWQLLRGLGVSHVAWHREKSQGWDDLAGDLSFFDFALNRTVGQQELGEFRLGELTSEPPAEAFDDRVVVVSCSPTLGTGVYRLLDLRAPAYGPRQNVFPAPREAASPARIAELAASSPFAVSDPRCAPAFLGTNYGLTLAARRRVPKASRSVPWELWLRTLPGGPKSP